MSRYLNATIADMRGGRESWRVVMFFALPAFLVAVGTALMHRGL